MPTGSDPSTTTVALPPQERAGATFRSRDLLVTLLGRHLHPRRAGVYSGTFITLMRAVGVREHTARSTLGRAVERGQLARERAGRRTYFRLTDRMFRTLSEGERRIYGSDPVLESWDGTWTLVSFSLPEERRTDRYRLRVRLTWAGFGPLRDGLWIAPGEIDLQRAIGHLGIEEHAVAFRGRLVDLGEPSEVLRQAWDLDQLSARYLAFLERWREAPATPDDALAEELQLITDWRLVLRDAPPLPAALLPDDWPATAARQRFLDLHQRWAPAADQRFLETVEYLEVRPANSSPRAGE